MDRMRLFIDICAPYVDVLFGSDASKLLSVARARHQKSPFGTSNHITRGRMLTMLSLFKTLWRKWQSFAHRLIKAQNWFLMSLVYWLALAPVAIAMKLKGSVLLDRSLGEDGAESLWNEREDSVYTMDKSQHMS